MRAARTMVTLLGIALSAGAAAMTLQRSTTLTDSFGGTLVAATSGSIDIPGAETTSQATLTNFHPHDQQNFTLDGSVTRTHERSGETVTNVYNGTVALAGTDKSGQAVDDTLVLQNVQIVRDGQGPAFSGTIVFNGASFDAAHLTDALKHRLRELLRVLALD